MNKNIKIIIIGFFISFLFVGCVTKPLTKNVINDIGVNDINRFQFFTSSEIRLTATERIREQNINRQGAARVRESSFRDILIINRNTMGVLMESRTDDDGLLILEICFEENATDSDKRITFRQDGPGLEHRFYVVYTDPRRRILRYGDRDYALETRSGERVALNIRISESQIEKKRTRWVKGRRVEN
ncbi:MAG: hypothetical protein FWC01_02855 [Treponema sp.]|nr:hypothetical protein [Treponema sp.]